MAAGVCLAQMPEASLTGEDFEKLDSFESVVLIKADKTFAAKDYRSAVAAYDSFLQQFPRSKATPYVLLRKGRAMQLNSKRFEAIKVYNEVLDYFPNIVTYAGAALYYMGECHWQNADAKEAMKAWAEMAKDRDYSKHPLAAGAINQLADNLVRQEKWSEAAPYYLQVAVDFRRANLDAAREAIEKVTQYYVRERPDAAGLRAAYDKTETFEPYPGAGSDTNFWSRAIAAIDRRGVFNEADRSNRDRYYQYWARAMEGKFPEWDDYQAAVARFGLMADGDAAKWMERLDKQFNQYRKDGDYARVVRWIGYYAASKPKLEEYYAKLSFEKMNGDQIVALIGVLYTQCPATSYSLAHNTILKLKPGAVSDDARERMAREWMWDRRDEEGVRLTAVGMKEADRGKMLLLRYYRTAQMADKGLALVDDLVRVPAYAKEALLAKGIFLQWNRKWVEAIAAFRLADSPPGSAFSIAECQLSDGKREQAVATLREIENFFTDAAPEAALRIAYAYRDTGEKKTFIAALRAVLKKYPGSSQSNTAHLELEKLGVKMGGGVDAE
jgi:TolA-binding protein